MLYTTAAPTRLEPQIRIRNTRKRKARPMLFKETDNKHLGLPTVILLHGGGLSWWSLSGIVELLKDEYHVVTPILDGHGEDGDKTFVSIEDSSETLLEYIDSTCAGEVFALCGLSLGAQIVAETLARRVDVCKFAVLESTLVLPIKMAVALTVPTYKLFYGLVKLRWFSRMQAKTLFVPSEKFEQYYHDSLNISKQSLINITISNGAYGVKSGIENSWARVLVIAGEKEIGIIKESARILCDRLPESTLYIAPRMGHGELSLAHPTEYVRLMKDFFAGEVSIPA
jgi:pimeloyl-ACP methyl ester carboxylesterase